MSDDVGPIESSHQASIAQMWLETHILRTADETVSRESRALALKQAQELARDLSVWRQSKLDRKAKRGDDLKEATEVLMSFS